MALRPFLALFIESANHNGQSPSVKGESRSQTKQTAGNRSVYQMETTAGDFKTKTKKIYALAKFGVADTNQQHLYYIK